MAKEIDDLRDNAERFRRLAAAVLDERNRAQLLDMAIELDKQADKLQIERRRNTELPDEQ